MESKIYVAIPAYNASKTIGNVVSAALKHVSTVIVIDDGSTDNTAIVAFEAGAGIITLGKNKGKGNALKIFFQKAIQEKFDAVITLDADGQHDPEEIPLFLYEHKLFPESTIVGNRFREKEKIPDARYNAMRIAQFYISLSANQYLEDSQCGFRLYPMAIIKNIPLTTERYVTESEILMKVGDMGKTIRFVDIKTIYNNSKSYLTPVYDVSSIAAYVISYIHIKWFVEGLTPNNPYTYSTIGYIRDTLGEKKSLNMFFQTLTVFTALPASIFFYLEYSLLQFFIPYNFASIRKLDCGFSRIVLATQMLPILLIVALIEKCLKTTGCKINLVSETIKKFYPNLWKNKR